MRRALGVLANYLVRVLAHLRPQRWCPPALSLRLFRWSSESTTAINVADLRRHLPATGWSTRTDLHHAPGRDGLFDLVLPDGPGPHPLVVWLHGGGWHFGAKGDVLPYVERIAARGYVGAVPNYPRAPRSAYPAAPQAISATIEHLLENAEEYRIDPDRVVLAGDSVGAQLAAELAVLATSPAYAAGSPFPSAMRPDQLRGVLLFGGIYQPSALDDSDRMFAAVLESAMWSVARSRAWRSTPACARMTVLDHVTGAFPPTFLAAGTQDPLTRRQTPPMAARLRELGVRVEEVTPGTEAAPAHHQFQFWLRTPAASEAFERAVEFLGRATGNSH